MRPHIVSSVIFGLTIAISFASGVLLNIPDGILRGTIEYDRYGNGFYSFQNIPYAQPPMGSLRFKDPIPNEPWSGIRDATQNLLRCVQGGTVGAEDCLYLNVHTPQLNPFDLKAVMVYFHGDGVDPFYMGSGMKDPEYLMPEDVVLVTISYRLNIFGFFSLADPSLETPGNAGLKDQRLALQWVQKNIRCFGGDPERVTIFGQGAGGASVHLHVLSPQSRGLFSNAIMQSGVAVTPWLVGVPNNGVLIAEELQISTDDMGNMLSALQSSLTIAVFMSFQLLTNKYPMRWGGFHMPIIENQVDESAFFIEEPLILIREGNYNKVPMLIGYTDAEGIYFERSTRNSSGQPTPVTDFFTFVPDELGVLPGTPEALQLAKEVKQFYQGDSEPSPENMQPLVDIYRDVWFAFPARRTALEHVKNNHHPVYFYRFSADTEMNVFKTQDEFSRTFKGAAHCDDTAYLFKMYNTPEIEEDSIESKAIDRVVKIWTNFAKYSNPGEDTWKPVEDGVMNYMDIGSTKNVFGVDPDDENMRFWLDVYERYGKQVP